jgi:hypothetical protein
MNMPLNAASCVGKMNQAEAFRLVEYLEQQHLPGLIAQRR